MTNVIITNRSGVGLVPRLLAALRGANRSPPVAAKDSEPADEGDAREHQGIALPLSFGRLEFFGGDNWLPTRGSPSARNGRFGPEEKRRPGKEEQEQAGRKLRLHGSLVGYQSLPVVLL